ncbi:hypothetical protein LTR94_036309, partial [Friedmanniomyces endolithicus]
DEFVSTQSACEIIVANNRKEPPRDFDQHLVTGGMAIAIIDRFKAIEVQIMDRKLVTDAGCLSIDLKCLP